MTLRTRFFVVLAALGLLAAAPASATSPPSLELPAVAASHVCGTPAPLQAQCHALVVTNSRGKPLGTTEPSSTSLKPTDLQSAYSVVTASPAPGTSSQTIAIVDAYDNPKAETNLGAYRTKFNLGSCTTANGCFTKIDQRGAVISGTTNAPSTNVGWSQEIDLDLQMASAICPNCKLVLVEADSNSFINLGTAVKAVVAAGANVVSNSYGGTEFSSGTSSTYANYFNNPGVAQTVSSGDNGYGVEFPAASPYVTAVGGTSLRRDTTTTRGFTESAWSGAGSGCSAYVAKPSWQPTTGSCTKRQVADVSAVADPATGVAVYTVDSSWATSWYVFGGTSAAAPIVGAVYALAGNASSITPAYPYAHKSSLFDITSGSNGRCTNGPKNMGNGALCKAVAGWDGPTGLGTPNGTGGF